MLTVAGLVLIVVLVGLLSPGVVNLIRHQRAGNRVVEALNAVNEIVAGVHDRESAEAAVLELTAQGDELGAALRDLRELNKSSPVRPDQDRWLREHFDKRLRRISERARQEADRISRMPDVAPIVDGGIQSLKQGMLRFFSPDERAAAMQGEAKRLFEQSWPGFGPPRGIDEATLRRIDEFATRPRLAPTLPQAPPPDFEMPEPLFGTAPATPPGALRSGPQRGHSTSRSPAF